MSPSLWNKHDTILFIVAHPDDESMFFFPTLQNLIRTNDAKNVHILCLSNGNYDNLGGVRSKEMLSACQIIGLETCNVQVLDDDRIQDGPHVVWDDGVVSGVIGEYLVQRVCGKGCSGCVRIITFDEYGVSGHPNHCDTSRGVGRFLYDVRIGNVDLRLKKLEVRSYRLRSVPVW
eukprot:CAMPEP_0116056952 /NCGR_PEP_ID=MMETSP0322-20121206/4322_1 /TAXON_ID=163516 /ORGANISM="Leptocylindrus danicus var. apora, Strain B651" /LENGTH=174 /DNA_ID=CAMNT_0003540871 /DNA_START=73 /DNA_END=594 /DNA_ORIENTATION=-